MENYHYEYFRSIGRTIKHNSEFFVGYVTIIKSEKLYNTMLKQFYKHRIETIDFSITDFSSEVHPLIRQIPSGDVTHELTKFSYDLLKELSEDDEISFWLYLTTFITNKEQ